MEATTNGNNGLCLYCSSGAQPRNRKVSYELCHERQQLNNKEFSTHGVETRVEKFLKRIPSVADKRLVIFQDSATRQIILSPVCLDILDYLNLSLVQASKQ